MKTLILAGVSVVALTIAGAGIGYAAGASSMNPSSTNSAGTSNPSASMSGGSSAQGMTGKAMTGEHAQLRQAQQKLKSAGLYKGRVDGLNGPETKQALMKFQQKNGLKRTGELDEQTLAKLDLGQSTSGSGSSTPENSSGESGNSQPGTSGTSGPEHSGGSSGSMGTGSNPGTGTH